MFLSALLSPKTLLQAAEATATAAAATYALGCNSAIL